MLHLFLVCTTWKMGISQLHYSVAEESQHGTFVGHIAKDLGLETDQLIHRMFQMESKDSGDYFEVNFHNGILFVNSRIDREVLCARNPFCIIHLEVIVDKPLKIFHIEVEIKDINDNAPLFSTNEQSLNIAELMLPGTRFPLKGASDADIGSNAHLKYKLSSTEYFTIEQKITDQYSVSLVLVLNKPLDREKTSVHHLLLTATDEGQPELTGTLQLEIIVMDTNDNAPFFNQSVYKVKILENVPNGTLVIILKATDLDEGMNKEISYSFSNNVPSDMFSIHSDTGEIKVRGEVDFEETSTYNIEIEAKDKGYPPLFGHCIVLIEILDINDNAPEMTLKYVLVPVPEDSSPGAVIVLISFTDRDSGSNGQVSCSLWPIGLPFKLLTTFKNYYSLVLTEPVDREHVAEFELLIVAQDQGSPSLSVSSSLVVPISDVNDNAPAFDQSAYTIFVKENNLPGAHIFTVSAADPDMAENGLVSYWLDEKPEPLSKYISVHSESGKMYVLQPLDYEELKLLEFYVNAKDAGRPSLSSNITVQIFVVDENDNAPVVSGLEKIPVLLKVPVMAGHLVGKICALDADAGYNAWLRYELHELTGGPWQVGLYSGEISIKHSLDETENSNSQTLLVLIKDHGEPPQSVTTTVSVSLVKNTQKIQDDALLSRRRGDMEPLMVNVNTYLIIAICSVSSLFLLVIILYVIQQCHSQVKETAVYGPGTATLVCTSEVGSWSYSNRHSHILGGISGETGAKTDLMVFSPNLPVFAENEEMGSMKDLVLVSSGQNLEIKPTITMIFLLQCCLLRKQVVQMLVLSWAWELGNSQQLLYSVPEESQQGTFVGYIAQDLGLEVEELVPRMFRMESQNQGDFLEVNVQNGILFVNSRIDREELCAKNADCVVHLEVIVEKPLTVFHVEIEIKDINDNAPTFIQKEQNIFVSEIRMPGSFFPLEGASDADIGPNSHLTYTLSSNEYFILDVQRKYDKIQSLGLLLKNSVDREVKATHYLLLVAIDAGKPELSGTTQLVISVLDENDNAPTFNQSVYKVQVSENIQNGTLVIKLNATDLDEGINKEVAYSFHNRVPVKLKNIFTLDSVNGEMRTIEKLDFEEDHQYEIQMQASDKGSHPMTGYCTIVIEVQDVNDNAPEIWLKSLSVPVSEDSLPGMVVALISISDRDSGINGQISCSLYPVGFPFRLVTTFKNYYSLIVAEPLDREQMGEYRLIVRAQDQGTPTLLTTSSLMIPIGDVNDNAPTFAQPSYTVFVKENNPPGAHIFTVSASDPDMAENALISYWIDEKFWPLSSYISVHSENGKLYVLQTLDYEELKLLEFQVSAKDAGLPSLCGNVTVQVFVMDENDNAPVVFALAEVNPVLLVVPVMAEQVVAKIHAADADSGYNAWLYYEIHENSSNSWRVARYSGEISTNHALTEEEVKLGSQNLLVLVKDHGKPMLSTTATLSVSFVARPHLIQTDVHLQEMGKNSRPLVDSINIYLIIATCSVSSLFLLTITVYTVMRCHVQVKKAMIYGPGTTTLVCASEVGSWSYSNRHSRILAAVSGESGIKSDLMVFSPNIPPLPPGSEKQEQICCDPALQRWIYKIEKTLLIFLLVFAMIVWKNESVANWLLQLVLLHTAWKMGSGQLHYSVLEESQHGTFVGRIAQDLGLEVSDLVPRMFRMLSKGEKDYFEVNVQNGILFVDSRIDREELCAKNADCVVHLEVIVEKPLRFFHVEVEIKDINDNAPIFSAREQVLSMAELTTASGTRFPLEGASDADISTNALLTYKLSLNEYFTVEQKTDEKFSKPLAIVLKKPLDREENPVHHLVLTATDGGEPKLTGTVQLVIIVLDVNDNPPVFNPSVYKVKLLENAAVGTLVIKVNATDLDEGMNKEINYSFTNHVPLNFQNIFSINSNTGEVTVEGWVDFEDLAIYDLHIVADDKGYPPLSGHCQVIIEVLDVNDNAPELFVSSLSVPVPEDSSRGTVVALISISDRDSGDNGQMHCSLWPPGMPFQLVSNFKNYYSLVVSDSLDREQVAEYQLMVKTEDQGVPSLSATSILTVPISDTNDNAPTFTQPSYTVFVKENNPPGAHIFTVSASDPDVAENALITYWIDEKLWPLSSYISVHSESGKLYALQPLDYEELKLLEFQVRAKDAGLPSLCGNATVQVFVMDENDNAPAVSRSSEENLILLVVPVMPGHIVGKIHALDADSGYNAWLSYELVEESSGPWAVGQYSGEVSTKYSLDESEGSKSQSVLVLVKDHGKPQLSTTATLSVSLVTSTQAIKTDIHLPRSGESFMPLVDSINIYLIIGICSVSSLFLLAILIYVALRCHCKAKETMVYGPGTATLVCASEVGSWSYSNRHSHILAGVSAEAGAKSDLMIFSPNVPVLANNGELKNGTEMPSNSSKEGNEDYQRLDRKFYEQRLKKVDKSTLRKEDWIEGKCNWTIQEAEEMSYRRRL
ncbi:uncharacterized protein LOC134494674 [Candoia aspera]|uniref:uncharacterized protein LOC134494674 n=1 Tax=Candoia aspera TaxID=51853 RepID=UPI002FD7CE55